MQQKRVTVNNELH